MNPKLLPTFSTYSLPHSRIGPMASSSASRYGFSIDYTDPYPSGQQSHPIWVSCLNPGTHSRSLLAKEDAGLTVPPGACTLSTCTAMHSVCIPTPQGSNAPVSRVEGGSSLAPLRLYPCYKALEDQQMQVRAPLDDLSRSASMTPKSPSDAMVLPTCIAPSVAMLLWGWTPISEAWSVT